MILSVMFQTDEKCQKKPWLGWHQMLAEMLADVSTFDKKTINIWVATWG